MEHKSPLQIAEEIKKVARSPARIIRQRVIDELGEEELQLLSRVIQKLNIDDADDKDEANEEKIKEDNVEELIEKKDYKETEYEKFRKWYDQIKNDCRDEVLEKRFSNTTTSIYLDFDWSGSNLTEYATQLASDINTIRLSQFTLMWNYMVLGKRFEEAYKLWYNNERKKNIPWKNFLNFIKIAEYNERYVRKLRVLYAQFKVYPRALWIPSSMNKIFQYSNHFIRLVENNKNELAFWRVPFKPTVKITDKDSTTTRPAPSILPADGEQRKDLLKLAVEVKKEDDIEQEVKPTVVRQEYNADAIKQTNDLLKSSKQ